MGQLVPSNLSLIMVLCRVYGESTSTVHDLGEVGWPAEEAVVAGEPSRFKGVCITNSQQGCLEQLSCQGTDKSALHIHAGNVNNCTLLLVIISFLFCFVKKSECLYIFM